MLDAGVTMWVLVTGRLTHQITEAHPYRCLTLAAAFTVVNRHLAHELLTPYYKVQAPTTTV